MGQFSPSPRPSRSSFFYIITINLTISAADHCLFLLSNNSQKNSWWNCVLCWISFPRHFLRYLKRSTLPSGQCFRHALCDFFVGSRPAEGLQSSLYVWLFSISSMSLHFFYSLAAKGIRSGKSNIDSASALSSEKGQCGADSELCMVRSTSARSMFNVTGMGMFCDLSHHLYPDQVMHPADAPTYIASVGNISQKTRTWRRIKYVNRIKLAWLCIKDASETEMPSGLFLFSFNSSEAAGLLSFPFLRLPLKLCFGHFLSCVSSPSSPLWALPFYSWLVKRVLLRTLRVSCGLCSTLPTLIHSNHLSVNACNCPNNCGYKVDSSCKYHDSIGIEDVTISGSKLDRPW